MSNPNSMQHWVELTNGDYGVSVAQLIEAGDELLDYTMLLFKMLEELHDGIHELVE